MKLELPRGAFGGDVGSRDYYTLDTLEWNTLMVNGNKPGRKIDTVDFRIPSNDPACPECGAINPELKPFKQQEMVAGIEHELTPTIGVSGRYVHKQVDRAIEDVGVIVPGIGEVFYIANPGEGVTTTIATMNARRARAAGNSARLRCIRAEVHAALVEATGRSTPATR